MIYVKCPFCRSNNYKIIYKKNIETGSKIGRIKLSNVMCKKCGLMYMNPRPNSRFWLDYYKNEKTSSANTFHSIQNDDRHSLLSEELEKFLLKQLKHKKNGKFLDVGCGQGDLLLKLNLSGWELWGLEQSKYAAKIASDKGLKIINKRIEQVKEEKYDVISSISSLEHVMNPIQVIKKMTKMLNTDGYLFIEVPDSTKPFITVAEFFSFEHLTHFTFETLSNILAKFDIKIIAHDKNPSSPTIRILGQKTEGFSKKYCSLDNREKLVKSLIKYKREKEKFENKIKKRFVQLMKEWDNNTQNIAIYGAGVHSLFLLNVLEIQNHIKCFFDSDKNKQNKKFLSWNVYNPKMINKLKINSIIISSKDYEEEIFKSLKKYEKDGIKIIRCYENLT